MKKMKETYDVPQMEIVEFESEDVITASIWDEDTLPIIPAGPNS